ncbi:hypothetical protein ZIOFF_040791 [Zingiber officinale]|uniref:Mannosyltransferase n=1 Tax=Zingiber officinale TaxID=94328 RepID=A0A8J5GD25_ZINOF|nr:hypothetical protein ZIOFF_040791 [Zingiber officinale]
MTLSVARQRRPRAEDQGASSSSSSASDRYWKEEKEKERAGVGWFLPSLLLGFLRHMSASSDIIHDCESATRSSITGNPSLHHLLYISGFQTWEYRFLYPIYPLICIAATVDIDSFPGLFRDKYAVEDSLIVMLRDIKHCTFFVELDLRRPYPARGSDLSTWETVAAIPFLDRELSPTMFRSFFIPYKWTQQNTFGLYKLLKKIPKSVEGHT